MMMMMMIIFLDHDIPSNIKNLKFIKISSQNKIKIKMKNNIFKRNKRNQVNKNLKILMKLKFLITKTQNKNNKKIN